MLNRRNWVCVKGREHIWGKSTVMWNRWVTILETLKK